MVEQGARVAGGAGGKVEEPEEGQGLQRGQQDPHITQRDGHVVEDHTADEGSAQEHHIEGQEPREELPGLLGLPVPPQQQREMPHQPGPLVGRGGELPFSQPPRPLGSPRPGLLRSPVLPGRPWMEPEKWLGRKGPGGPPGCPGFMEGTAV